MGGDFMSGEVRETGISARVAVSRLRSVLGIPLRVPVVQAVLGECAGTTLIRAVDRAGALPTLAVHGWRPARAKRGYERVRAVVGNRCMIAFTGDWEREEVLDDAFAAGFRLFQTFWWNSERLIPRIRAGGGRVLVQVGSMAQVAEAMARGADALLLQGTEAGGPVRSSVPLADFLIEVRETYGPDPVVLASGGLSDRADLEWVLENGGDAGVFGTRFLVSEESRADRRDKIRLCRASAEALLLDTRLVGPWPCSPRRRLPTVPDVDRPGLYAGLGVGAISGIASVAEIVARIAPPTP